MIIRHPSTPPSRKIDPHTAAWAIRCLVVSVLVGVGVYLVIHHYG